MALIARCAEIAIGFLVLAGAAQAQQYPTRPARFIVPFPPGTTTDVVARLVGQRIGERLGQPIVVDYRSGASGTIGVETARRRKVIADAGLKPE